MTSLDRFQSIDPALLDIRPTDRVIDLGCGTGRHVLELSKRPANVLGADISRHDLRIGRYLLEIMRRRGEVRARVHWLQTAGERLPFRDAAFDHVICTETLEHVDDDRRLAGELVRVLRPGGILAVSVPDEYSEKLFWRLSKNYRTHAGGHVRVYERRAIVRLLRDAGLRPYAVRYRHALETVYWLSHIAFWSDWGQQGPITRRFREALDSQTARRSRLISAIDDIGNRVLPKSIVVYSRKPLVAAPSANGDLPRPTLTVDDTPDEFGRPEHMRADDDGERGRVRLPRQSGAGDERTTVEVRAVPAPFAIDAPAQPDGDGAPTSLREELRRASRLEPQAQKQRLIETLRSCRFAMMRALDGVDGEEASTPCTPDGRTLKEIVAHIMAWERWSVAAFEEIANGVLEPSVMTLTGYPQGTSHYSSVDSFNAARMAEARERPWSGILEESGRVFDRLIAAAESADAAQLARTAPFYWPEIGATVPCGMYLLMVAAHHYQEEHLPEVTGQPG